MRHLPAALALLVAPVVSLALPAAVWGQTEGAVAGRVYESESNRSLSQAQILIDNHVKAITDTGGIYRARAIRSGWHSVTARLIGYRSLVRDSVFVRAGATVTVDFPLQSNPLQLAPIVVSAPVDPVLDPLATATEQKITAADLRELPISSLQEALTRAAARSARTGVRR